jgi:hypothetical protein
MPGAEVRVSVGERLFFFPRRPEGLRGPFTILSNGYRGYFPRKQNGRGLELTSRLELGQTSGIRGYIHSPIRLHSIVLS